MMSTRAGRVFGATVVLVLSGAAGVAAQAQSSPPSPPSPPSPLTLDSAIAGALATNATSVVPPIINRKQPAAKGLIL